MGIAFVVMVTVFVVMRFTNISDYADASSVSPYAKKYMEWAVAEGLIKGREEGLEMGRELEKRTMIQNMISSGLPDELIVQIAECSLELIEKIKKEIQ